MLRWVILAVAVVGLTAVATFVVQYLPDPEAAPRVPVEAATGPRPKLELDQDLIYEFGKMAQHTLGKHTWQVKNAGERDLELWMEGKPTCSCTIAKLENGQKAVLKPGESTTIDLEWNTKDFQEKYSQGATFGTNDPGRPTFHLTVAGQVYPPVIVFPDKMLQFPAISNEEPHKARLAVFSQDRPQMKVTKAVTSKPGVIVAHVTPMNPEDAKQIKVEGGYSLEVELLPGLPQGVFHEDVTIQTDHPNQPEVKVTIAGRAIGPISVVPEGLRMAGANGLRGSAGALTLLVRGNRETHFEVMKKPEKVQVDVQPDTATPAKGRYRLTVTIPPGTPAGPVDGEIVLKTDHPRASELKIPVHILVSRTGVG
jgi:hypothetical protein